MKASPVITVTCVGCQGTVLLDLVQAHEDLTHYERACPGCGMLVLLSFSPSRSSTPAVKLQITRIR